MRHVLFICAGLMATAGSTATAQETGPIFEIPFGQQLAQPFPPCDAAMRDRTDWCDKFGTRVGPGALILLMRPPIDTPKKIPSWITSGTTAIRLDQAGNVASITVSTVGPERQASVIESVEARFGKPTTVESRQAKNAYGASWPVVKAEWALPTIRIYHDCYRRDECTLTFETPAYAAQEKEKAAKQREKDRL